MTSVETRDDLTEIRAALPALRRHTHLPVVFGGEVGSSGRVRYSELSGTTTDAIRGLVVTPGRGLGGKSLTTQRPLWVQDYVNTAGISHDYDTAVTTEGLRAIVAVPIVVRNRARGLLLGALRQSVPLGERVIDSAVAAARGVEQDIAVRDEAQRRMVELDRARAARPSDDAARERQWEEIRELHTELRTLASDVADTDLQARLLDVSARMASAADQQGRPREATAAPVLAPREIDVLACAALGHTNTGIAEHLGLRAETVKSYLRSAMRRLGAHTRLEAVNHARRSGLLP